MRAHLSPELRLGWRAVFAALCAVRWFYFFFQRAAAAFFAMALRFAAVSFLARALPPLLPSSAKCAAIAAFISASVGLVMRGMIAQVSLAVKQKLKSLKFI